MKCSECHQNLKTLDTRFVAGPTLATSYQRRLRECGCGRRTTYEYMDGVKRRRPKRKKKPKNTVFQVFREVMREMKDNEF